MSRNDVLVAKLREGDENSFLTTLREDLSEAKNVSVELLFSVIQKNWVEALRLLFENGANREAMLCEYTLLQCAVTTDLKTNLDNSPLNKKASQASSGSFSQNATEKWRILRVFGDFPAVSQAAKQDYVRLSKLLLENNENDLALRFYHQSGNTAENIHQLTIIFSDSKEQVGAMPTVTTLSSENLKIIIQRFVNHPTTARDESYHSLITDESILPDQLFNAAFDMDKKTYLGFIIKFFTKASEERFEYLTDWFTLLFEQARNSNVLLNDLFCEAFFDPRFCKILFTCDAESLSVDPAVFELYRQMYQTWQQQSVLRSDNFNSAALEHMAGFAPKDPQKILYPFLKRAAALCYASTLLKQNSVKKIFLTLFQHMKIKNENELTPTENQIIQIIKRHVFNIDILTKEKRLSAVIKAYAFLQGKHVYEVIQENDILEKLMRWGERQCGSNTLSKTDLIRTLGALRGSKTFLPNTAILKLIDDHLAHTKRTPKESALLEETNAVVVALLLLRYTIAEKETVITPGELSTLLEQWKTQRSIVDNKTNVDIVAQAGVPAGNYYERYCYGVMWKTIQYPSDIEFIGTFPQKAFSVEATKQVCALVIK